MDDSTNTFSTSEYNSFDQRCLVRVLCCKLTQSDYIDIKHILSVGHNDLALAFQGRSTMSLHIAVICAICRKKYRRDGQQYFKIPAVSYKWNYRRWFLSFNIKSIRCLDSTQSCYNVWFHTAANHRHRRWVT